MEGDNLGGNFLPPLFSQTTVEFGDLKNRESEQFYVCK